MNKCFFMNECFLWMNEWVHEWIIECMLLALDLYHFSVEKKKQQHKILTLFMNALPTDQPTNWPMDTAYDGDARMHLKTSMNRTRWEMPVSLRIFWSPIFSLTCSAETCKEKKIFKAKYRKWQYRKWQFCQFLGLALSICWPLFLQSKTKSLGIHRAQKNPKIWRKSTDNLIYHGFLACYLPILLPLNNSSLIRSSAVTKNSILPTSILNLEELGLIFYSLWHLCSQSA